MSELLKYVNGEAKPSLLDRGVAKRSREIYNEVRLAALKSDGQMALAAHMMQQVSELDAHRVAVAGDDPIINGLLLEIEVAAINKAKHIHGKLFSEWGL